MDILDARKTLVILEEEIDYCNYVPIVAFDNRNDLREYLLTSEKFRRFASIEVTDSGTIKCATKFGEIDKTSYQYSIISYYERRRVFDD